jgi:hypothetical protein
MSGWIAVIISDQPVERHQEKNVRIFMDVSKKPEFT